MSSVAVVIPSWNTAGYLERCLASVAEQTEAAAQTLVIDNGSTDGTLEMLSARGVDHVALPRNTGFAAAVNLGVSKTSSRLVLVLNADCFLGGDCLRRLAAGLEAHGQLGGVQPRILQAQAPNEPARIYSAGQCLTRYGRAFERGWDEPDGPRFADDCEVFGVSGAACLLRRELFDDLGGYDASYFAFFEDVDLNARARLAGWRFAYVADAFAVHVGHAAWRQESRSHAFNVELTVRNRLATACKVLPAQGVTGAVVLTLRSLAASPFRGSTSAALRGTLTAVRWLPRLLGERRRLRRGSAQLLDTWLARAPSPGPDPAGL